MFHITSKYLVAVRDDIRPIQSPGPAAAAACRWDVCGLARRNQEGSDRPDAQ